MNKSFAIILMSFLLLLSCASKQEMETADTDQAAVEHVEEAKAQLAATPNTDLYSNGQTKLIKTANYRFEVANVMKSAEEIELAIRKYPAYISASDRRLENPILENKMTIRVRNEFFQDLLKEIDQQAKFINYRDIKTEDVAKQFVDLESRLKTKREIEARYIEIVRKKAGTIEELLNAEEQIGELQEEIEATISRINYLKVEVSYSTIKLEFYQTISQEVAVAHETPKSKQFGEALQSGWNGVVMVALALTYLWPWLVLAGLSVVAYRYLRKKKVMTTSV